MSKPISGKRWIKRIVIAGILSPYGFAEPVAINAQDKAPGHVAVDSKKKLDAVVTNAPDEPRPTPVTRTAMKQYLEDLKYRSPRIPLPELTDEEKKLAIEDPRTYGYEGRIRKLFLKESTVSNYLPFGGVSKTANPQSVSRSGPVDPKMTLDYAFKVRLFWIAARGNNCQYCLGHQESKLLAAGMNEDEIAALDSDWELFPESEQAAFSLARRLTLQPHLVSDEDINLCRKFYTDEQIIEMIGSIAGNNAINRWKEGAGVPQSTNGGNFGAAPQGASDPKSNPPSALAGSENHSYLTATSDKYSKRKTQVAAVEGGDLSLVQSSPTQFQRPPLESGDELKLRLDAVKRRTPRLPLVNEETAREVLSEFVEEQPVLQWHRLLANFPIAGKRLVSGIAMAKQSDELSPVLQLKIDWVIARQDRAWYAAALAREQMLAAGVSQAEIDALDKEIKLGDVNIADPKAIDRERAILILAKNLAASPIVLTDRQTAVAVKLAGARAVTQAINYAAYRAAFDRITEAAGLGL